MGPFFQTKKVSVGYDGIPLIQDINIKLDKGKILTLIGPNGSGKSTILKTITKHLKNICGTVLIDRHSIDGMGSRELSRLVSVVFTERLKTERMTCEDVVATGRYPYTGLLGILSQEDHAQIQNAMELVHAWDLWDKDYTAISDGQRQRVLLARAICQEPQVIILDEPTSFLDIRYKLELLHLLRKMTKEKNITVIMSLHELDLAQKASDFVMCVKGESVTHFGPPNEIFTKAFIENLYQLSNGSYNPLYGSFEMERPKGDPKVFVIAGAGSGIPQYRILQKKGIPFMTGILHQNDIDYPAACDLASEVFSEKAFCPICDETYAEAEKQLSSCQTVIDCIGTYGSLNIKNFDLAQKAKKLGLKIVETAENL